LQHRALAGAGALTQVTHGLLCKLGNSCEESSAMGSKNQEQKNTKNVPCSKLNGCNEIRRKVSDGPAKASRPGTSSGAGLPAELVIRTTSFCTSGESLPLRNLGTRGKRFPVLTKMQRYDFRICFRHSPPPLAPPWVTAEPKHVIALTKVPDDPKREYEDTYVGPRTEREQSTPVHLFGAYAALVYQTFPFPCSACHVAALDYGRIRLHPSRRRQN
jgi:hypothetical protein